jgi:hypothetical protein
MAMEHLPFIDDFPIKASIDREFPVPFHGHLRESARICGVV